MRILVIDDSALMRQAMTGLLESLRNAEVAVARDGEQGLQMVADWDPDVVTLDMTMPGMDGLTCLKHVMAEHPRPVIILSASTPRDSGPALEALSVGAFEVVEKPNGRLSTGLEDLGRRIKPVVREAFRSRLRGPKAPPPAPRPAIAPKPTATRGARSRPASGDLVLIGVSTGGPSALEQIIPVLPPDLPVPVLVAQHMPGSFTASFARRLDERSAIRVREARGPTPLEPGTVYIAHGESDMVVQSRRSEVSATTLKPNPAHSWHPSVDLLVESALLTHPPERLLGVLLTGMGNDGARAMTELARRGGHTIAEDESTAVVFGMPRELIDAGGAKKIAPLPQIADEIVGWVRRKER